MPRKVTLKLIEIQNSLFSHDLDLVSQGYVCKWLKQAFLYDDMALKGQAQGQKVDQGQILKILKMPRKDILSFLLMLYLKVIP